MILKVLVDTAEAEQGFSEGHGPTMEEHRSDIAELLRSGYYDTISVEVL